MTDPARYLAKAEELLQLAARSRSVEERAAFLELAAGWQELANQAEQMTGKASPPVDDSIVIPFTDERRDPETD